MFGKYNKHTLATDSKPERVYPMADTNRGNRPLSPHLTIYKPQITSILSILNRITGIAMAFPVILIVIWFLSAAISPSFFGSVDWFITSWFGLLILVASLWAFWFHFLNGLRHLAWDMIWGLDMSDVNKTGWLVFYLSIIATVLCVAFAAWAG